MGMADHVTLDFVADIICPWCWIARRRLDAAAITLATDGLHIRWVWRPLLLYPDMPPEGVQQERHLIHRFGSVQAADRYHEGVAEAGRAVGIKFRYDRISRTPSSVDAHRLLLRAAPAGRQPALADMLAQAFFTDGHDIGNRAVLTTFAIDAGLDPALVRETLASSAGAEEVHASDQLAKAAGIRAVPAFCLHGRILKPADPEDLTDAIRQAHQALMPKLRRSFVL
jgi:predicted DsbA family dithiol-disulfide isomerase